MFVSRTEELTALHKLYDKDKFQMIVMYGRRRVGKTTLITEFLKDKPAIFFSAQEANEHLNLQLFSEKVYGFFGLPKTTGVFSNWNDAFLFIADRAKTQKFILAIDEFPYIAASNKSVKSILQNVIDHELLNSKLYLILCGSQISFMENDVLGYKSPLFGRRTAQFQIKGFDYYDAAKMLGNASNEDKIKYYACIGGTPHYLAQIDSSLSFEENITDLLFNPQGYLYNEPAMLLQQELREPAMYNSIISAIATGASRLNDISTKIGEDTSKTIKYVKTLMDLKILHRECPFGDNPERSRKNVYLISDNCYQFWYKYVFLNKASIETGTGKEFAENMVFPELSSFIGKPAFEEVCKQYIIRQNKQKRLPFLATNFGIWWGNDKFEKKNADFDVVADNKAFKKILLCECKWRNEAHDVSEIRKLMSKTYLMPGYDEYNFMFFSKAPYSREAKRLESKTKNLKLITLDMLFD
ncbi:MAG TPA: ATP-binding protein [Syntrophomonas sp.]|nr:ATP-binding protein [Syntrophomonas sp.]